MKKFLLRLVNMAVDMLPGRCTPAWRRCGREALELLTRYLHYYGPQLKADTGKDLLQTKQRLRTAILYRRREEVRALTARVTGEYVKLPGFVRSGWVELTESLFVITAVFLGIRTYFVQPFRIPTNSMWPSLNGIVVHPVKEIPGIPRRIWDAVTLGSSYVDAKADRAKCITSVKDERSFLLFTRTLLEFDDGSTLSIPAASGTVLEYLRNSGKLVHGWRGPYFVPYAAGEVIMRARVDAGDMVLADRISYHFRRPRRGESFVFDTRGLFTHSASLRDQGDATHYIKRLCALPGDTVSIRSPQLIINGHPEQAPGIARVAAARPPYKSGGYCCVGKNVTYPNPYLGTGRQVHLSPSSPAQPYLREYLALGDNTTNSLDSRYWGPVRQFNILGPACFTLWPFTAHWGPID